MPFDRFGEDLLIAPVSSACYLFDKKHSNAKLATYETLIGGISRKP
ncbi:MAG: hypothetical protein ABJL67_18785 [Sulfitobacter sp.]